MRNVDELETLSRALLGITGASGAADAREVLQVIVDSARELIGADYAALGIPDAEGRFSDFYASGVPADQWERIGPVPRVHGMLGALFEDGMPVRMDDVREHEHFSGWPSEHPVLTAFLGSPITDHGQQLGALWVANGPSGRRFADDDESRLDILAAHAAIAITRARLFERERELTLIDERSRIARELHDAVAQKLFSLRLTLGAAETLAGRGAVDQLPWQLSSAKELAASALDELRAVVAELRPPELREDGLVPALRKHLEIIGRAYHVSVGFRSDCDGRCALEDTVEETLFRVAQEAVHNAVRHGSPDSVEVVLETRPGGATLRVVDDGVGFEAGSPATNSPGAHLGIVSMKERARQVGGRVRVHSRPGAGTTIEFEVPKS